MNKEYLEVKNKIIRSLADYLGTDPEDIEDDFSLSEDLHMKPTDITDYSLTLSNMDIDASKLDFTQIDTVEDLVEAITEII